MDLTLILGGARSGKSRYAQQLAASHGERVLFVATAERGDAEMASRIDAHRRSRPRSWTTIEAPFDVANAMQPYVTGAEAIVLDCLTLLVANLGQDDVCPETWQSKVSHELEAILGLAAENGSHFIMVSNDVGSGLVPAYPLGRAYRDILGSANQVVARAASRVYFMVAGIPVCLKHEE